VLLNMHIFTGVAIKKSYAANFVAKSTLIESHQWNKTKMCGAKDSGNPSSKCLQAITHTKSLIQWHKHKPSTKISKLKGNKQTHTRW